MSAAITQRQHAVNEASQTGDGYRARIAAGAKEIAELNQRSRWFSRARGVVFLIALLFALLGWAESGPPWLMFTVAALVFLGFVAVVGFHGLESLLVSVLACRS